MAREHVELVRRLFEQIASGEGARAFEVYDPEIEWDASQTPWLLELGLDPILRGHDEVRAAMRDFFAAWESIDYRPEELIDAGDEVVAFVRTTARGRVSGLDVTYHQAQVWTFRDGKVVRVRVFAEREDALRAVGLG